MVRLLDLCDHLAQITCLQVNGKLSDPACKLIFAQHRLWRVLLVYCHNRQHNRRFGKFATQLAFVLTPGILYSCPLMVLVPHLPLGVNIFFIHLLSQ